MESAPATEAQEAEVAELAAEYWVPPEWLAKQVDSIFRKQQRSHNVGAPYQRAEWLKAQLRASTPVITAENARHAVQVDMERYHTAAAFDERRMVWNNQLNTIPPLVKHEINMMLDKMFAQLPDSMDEPMLEVVS